MSTLLQQAFEKASALPPADQEVLAEEILELVEDRETASERKAAQLAAIRRMEQEAKEEHRLGLTRPLDELLDEV